MNRRSLLRASALISVAAIAACASGTPTTSQIATDVNLLATGLAPVVASLSTTPGVSPVTIAQAQAWLAIIQKDAAQIAASTANPPAGTVQEVVQTVQALAAVAGTIPALAPYAVVIQAAVALLPVILSLAGVQVSSVKPAAMSPDAARAILAKSH